MEYALVQGHVYLVSNYLVQCLEVLRLELLTRKLSVYELRGHITHHYELALGLVELQIESLDLQIFPLVGHGLV